MLVLGPLFKCPWPVSSRRVLPLPHTPARCNGWTPCKVAASNSWRILSLYNLEESLLHLHLQPAATGIQGAVRGL